MCWTPYCDGSCEECERQKNQMKKIENQLQVVHTEKNVFGKL